VELYDLGEGALRAVPRRLAQAAALLLAAGLFLNAGQVTSLVAAIVTSRAESVVRHVQDSLQESPLLRPSAASRG
jgi:hypothetical protein